MHATLTRPGKTQSPNHNNAVTSQLLSRTHSLVLTTVIYTVVIKCTAGARWRKTKRKNNNNKTKQKTSFSSDWGSFSSQRGLRYFALFLKLMDRRSVKFMAFIRPVVQWITRQRSFASILSPWNTRFSPLLVPGKYSYALGQQPSWRVTLTFTRQSIRRTRENLNERGLF